MRATTPRPTTLIALAAATLALAFAAPAQAIYIATPLQLSADHYEADVGDNVTFTIDPSPDNETAQDDYAGHSVYVYFTYDRFEGQDAGPENETSDSGQVRGEIGLLLLDDKAHGSLTWTIPAEIDDRNVQVLAEDRDGRQLGWVFLVIGDAEPMAHILAASSGPGLENGTPSGPSDDDLDTDAEDTKDNTGEATAPGFIVLLALLAATAVALTGLLRRV